jgi:hypothetical protein
MRTFALVLIVSAGLISAATDAVHDGIMATAARSLRVAILDDDPSVKIAIRRLLNASGMIGDSFATSIDLFNAMETARPRLHPGELLHADLGWLGSDELSAPDRHRGPCDHHDGA